MRFTVRNVGSTVPRVASKLASCGRAIGRHCFHIHGDSGEEVITVRKQHRRFMIVSWLGLIVLLGPGCSSSSSTAPTQSRLPQASTPVLTTPSSILCSTPPPTVTTEAVNVPPFSTIDSVATTDPPDSSVPPDSGVPPTLAPNVASQTAEDDVSIGSGPFDLESTVAGLADRAGTPRR
jgi:hypothetical protein